MLLLVIISSDELFGALESSPMSRTTKSGVLLCTLGEKSPTELEGDDRRLGELGVGDHPEGQGVVTLVTRGLGGVKIRLFDPRRLEKGDLSLCPAPEGELDFD